MLVTNIVQKTNQIEISENTRKNNVVVVVIEVIK